MRIRLFQTLILAAVLSLLATTSALAHSPVFNDRGSPSLAEAFPIDDLQVSKALMGALRQPGAVDYYRIDAPEGFRLSLSLFVPYACEGFTPQMALIGPGLEPNAPGISLEIPEGAAAQEIALPPQDWGTFFEPFDPNFYHSGPQIEITTQAATYYLAVYEADGKTGSYMLGTGGAEQWTPDEDWRARKVAYDRCESGQADFWWQNWRRFAGGLALAGVLGGGALVLSRRARSNRSAPTEIHS